MAVYTHVSEQELRTFAAGYDLPALAAYEGIAQGVENTNYLLRMVDGKQYILTLFEKRTDPADLPFFFSFSSHLASRGIDCPRVLPDRKGGTVGLLCGRPAAIITFLEGRDITVAEATPAHCASLGTVLARMHVAALDGFSGRRDNALGLDGWRMLAEKTQARADSIAPGLAQDIADEIAFLARAWPRDLPQGAVHADLFPDNVFFTGTQVSGVIDFYFSCTDYFAYDLAIVMNAWCFDINHTMADIRMRAMIDAYQSVRPLSTDEHAALPVLLRGAALRFLLTRLHDWVFHPPGALVTPKDPLEYLKKLHWHRGHDVWEG